MGSADIILDLVSTGVTLRENNLKQIAGGTIMHSQGALVANRRALLERPVRVCVIGGRRGPEGRGWLGADAALRCGRWRPRVHGESSTTRASVFPARPAPPPYTDHLPSSRPLKQPPPAAFSSRLPLPPPPPPPQGLLEICHELLERLEAHLTANAYYSVIANMRGGSAAEVSLRLLQNAELAGLSGPTVSRVYTLGADGKAEPHLYAATICVPKKRLYPAVKEIRKARPACPPACCPHGAQGCGPGRATRLPRGVQGACRRERALPGARRRRRWYGAGPNRARALRPPLCAADWRQRRAGAAHDLHL